MSNFHNHTKSFVAQLSEIGIWFCDDLFSQSILANLLKEADQRKREGSFKQAKIGKLDKKTINTRIRKDQICWIMNWSFDPFRTVEKVFLEIQTCARRELFLPIKRFESHFSFYERGAYYKPHVDRHTIRPGRELSLVLYLNDLEREGGGELVVETHNNYPGGQNILVIRPKAGRCVIFDSRLRHEVKPVYEIRKSLTCWFRSDAIMGIEGI